MNRFTVVALVALVACGREDWREVDARLQSASAPARAAGFEPLAGPYNNFGAFRDSVATSWTVDLDSGTTYVAGAACTEDCQSLDLRVASPHHTGLAGDTAASTAPFLTFDAPETGAYTLTLRGQCAGRCRWAAQVYARNASATLRPGFAGGEH